MQVCDLNIYTSRYRYALSVTGQKWVSFMIGDVWTERWVWGGAAGVVRMGKDARLVVISACFVTWPFPGDVVFWDGGPDGALGGTPT